MADYDLHSHTNHSDGTLTPQALVEKAVEMKVKQLAITDHDTTSALADAELHAQQFPDLTIVKGIELSCRWNKQDVHIVGLGIDPDSPVLIECIEQQQQARVLRAKKISEKLEKQGYPGAFDYAQDIAHAPTQITRPHFAQFLVEQKAVKTIPQAFKKYLGQGKLAYVSTEWLSVEEAIQVIANSGGLSVLAHPSHYSMTRTKLSRLLKDFASAGGDAMEVITSNQTSDVSQWLANKSLELNLKASQGSDFHGAKMPWAKLGRIPSMPKNCAPIWESDRWPASPISSCD